MWNFCSFTLKKKDISFLQIFFLRIENLVNEIKCLYYKRQQLKWCYDKQLVHITVVLRSKNIFSSLESVQRLQLLNMHLVNFKFVLTVGMRVRNYFFTVFAIYFVDRKYEVNSWIDIGIIFDIFRIYIFNVEFSYFSISQFF